MNELKDYDDAIVKFRKSLKQSILPVISWDFYGKNYEAINNAEDDMNSLLSLSSINSWSIDTKILDKKLKTDKNIIVITDTNLNIVFATRNMWDMSQYHPDEIIGKSPKMFQGKLTTTAPLKIISKAVKEQQPFEVTVVNYRKDGSIYNCCIKGAPIFNTKGKVVNFIAFEKEVA
ncbi:PAS domain S-box-containing protein [Maribacter sedimenticola]|uniref:PAS domain S-box-containing protein n=1 Tax=Maribacter sedimenticola TaxID=228956 RepID=A0ABY1SJG5_9FLAO|nr:PAS domain-containing protein [Maribacter sedimenticola]SNR58076.1 PAS domain S-box-containing protein [Maribacter sedimenticola]